MDHGVDVHQPFAPIDCIKDPPVGHRILVQSGQIPQFLVPKVLGVGSNPFGLVE